jgi:magnesium-transporting ATPase (P-type)
LISGFHVLEQTVFVIELGLIVFLFLFAAYFHLSWNRLSFGVLLGLSISAGEHLATWALIANASPSEHTRTLFGFIGMATYHVCVLIWFYYVLVPQKVVKESVVPLPENNLALWNRELERLLQQ